MIAIELIEEASIAVGSMMSTLFFPIIPFILESIVIVWFIVVAMFLASSGEAEYRVHNLDECACVNPEDDKNWKEDDECEIETFNCNTTCPTSRCEFFRYGPTKEANYLQIYNLFGLFWGMFFVSALDQMVLAGAFASWYWTFDKRKVPSMPLMSSFFRTFRYHLGTLAFGSLIIAIIRMIRVMLQWVENKLKEYHQENPLVKAVMCFCKCCFWCLERFMKFINRNAYIMTAVYGKNFCWSAKESFSLLMRNVARVIVLDSITDFLLFLGKLVIVGSVAIGSFYTFAGKIDVVGDHIPSLNYYFIPVILVTLGAFFHCRYLLWGL